MARIILAPGFPEYIRKSVVEGIPLKEFTTKDSSLNESVQRFYASSGRVTLWGLKALKLWKETKSGDYVLFYRAGKFPYVGKVLFLYPRDDTEEQLEEATKIAEKVWGRNSRDGKTWPYLIFLHDIREVNLPLEKFNELTGYKFKAVMGSRKVREDRAEKLLAFLNDIYQVKPPEISPPVVQSPSHGEIVNMICKLGEMLGFYVKREDQTPDGAYRCDVTWRDYEGHAPLKVFEVELSGNVDHALASLAHAYDIWRSEQLYLVVQDERDSKRAEKLLGPRVKGAFAQISHRLRIIGWFDLYMLYDGLKQREELVRELAKR